MRYTTAKMFVCDDEMSDKMMMVLVAVIASCVLFLDGCAARIDTPAPEQQNVPTDAGSEWVIRHVYCCDVDAGACWVCDNDAGRP